MLLDIAELHSLYMCTLQCWTVSAANHAHLTADLRSLSVHTVQCWAVSGANHLFLSVDGNVHCIDGSLAVIHMSQNPLLDKLNADDLSQLLTTEGPLQDNVVTFLLGLIQQEAQQQRRHDWLIFSSFFFEQLYRSS